jgi:hypothetical protein
VLRPVVPEIATIEADEHDAIRPKKPDTPSAPSRS